MKIALGTAQFGMDYGLSNTHGKTDKYEVSKILQYAYDYGISLIDTASSYGDSEKILGEVITNYYCKLVTKTPHFSDSYIDNSHVVKLKESFHQSLFNLKQKDIYGLLLHSCDDLLKPGGGLLLQEMEDLKSMGVVKKIGVSLYNSEQIDIVLSKFNIDLVQLPINIFDQQLLIGGWLDKLKDYDVEIHARSAFLQGLLLMTNDLVPPYFFPIKKNLEAFYKSAKELSLSQLELALGYVMGVSEIDQVVVGVNTVEQLKEIIKATQVQINPMDFTDIYINDPAFTNPSLWKV